MLFLGYDTVMGESYETGNKNRIHIPQHCMNNSQKMFVGVNCIFIYWLEEHVEPCWTF